MRSLCAHLAGAVLLGPLIVLATGCGGGTSAIEKPPANVTPGAMKAEDMPGYKGINDTVKTKK
jgi:hypothetical protein